ncbi:MAG: vitamin B12-dependent ribonucleotide reductase [Thermodesulfobacteriota bacterium]|nr:MAG: vitamin B12-dependent ribonucleotide reductase [Thermodesulfobacteriota bacterium]
MEQEVLTLKSIPEGAAESNVQVLKQRVEISENCRKVLEKRYLKKDAEGNTIETVEEMFWRVSANIAEAEKNYDDEADTMSVALEFYRMMASLEFMPNSPTLMNAGRDLQQLSACFVLPIEDSMESIFDAVKHTALIHKSGGGTGFSFSRLRPSGDLVGSTSGISSGPISFMTVFDGATEAIKQGGTRRGANMGILRVDHPDIMKFISCKEDNTKLNNFNISVNITEEFMEAVDAGSDYDLKNPRNQKTLGSLNAKEVFDKIVDMAWKNGEPGIIFIDRINAENPTPHVGEIESTNPCGEQPLLPYESCNLGSINLNRMVKKAGDGSDSGYELDEEKLKETVKKAVRFLDNVIDMNRYPIDKIDAMTKSNRKIGLGVMGFADMLIKLSIPYDSEEAIEAAEKVMSLIQATGREASMELARARGTFPNYTGSVYDRMKIPVRNATVTTIAPTGTISIISSCSSGVEPIFALAFTRNVMDGAALLEVNPLFEDIARKRGFDSPELMKEVADAGTLHGIEGIPDDVKRVFVTAHDITPEWHIRMQAAFQKYTDNAVSKTVNFPNEATVEDVARVYGLAHKLGCKGVTVYRDGSRDAQVLQKGSEKKTPLEATQLPVAQTYSAASPRPRGEIAFGITRKIKTGCGNLYVTINEDEEGQPIEIFTQIGKAGGCVASQCEAMGRMTSLALRSGVVPAEIIKQMRGISCHLPVGFGATKVTSCADAMAKAMEWYMLYKTNGGQNPLYREKDVFDTPGTGTTATALEDHLDFTPVPSVFKRGACPDCGGSVEHADGCVVCRGCGYTECG